MTYYTAFVLAVPAENKQSYADHATATWPMFKRLGALRMVECWGEDVPHGHVVQSADAGEVVRPVPLLEQLQVADQGFRESRVGRHTEARQAFRQAQEFARLLAAIAAAPVYARAPGLLRGAGDIRRVRMYSQRTGESVNTVTTYGYDSVTQMQETKTTLCRIEAA